VHHDGDPINLSMSFLDKSGQNNANLSFSIGIDPNSNGSSPASTLIRSNATGAIVAQWSCSSPAICYGGTGTYSATGYTSAEGIPSGTYTLIVSYWDGTWAAHSLPLSGNFGNGNFGKIFVTTQ
jgi:hypothetical protein